MSHQEDVKDIEENIKHYMSMVNNLMREARLKSQKHVPWLNGTWVDEKTWKAIGGSMILLGTSTERAVQALKEVLNLE